VEVVVAPFSGTMAGTTASGRHTLTDGRVMLMERLPLLEIAEHDLTESLLSEARDAKKSKSGPGEKIRRPRKKGS
jgi:hypothetical protein